MSETPATPADAPDAGPAAIELPPFGVNEVRLNLRQWLLAAVIVVVVATIVPRAWRRAEPLTVTRDYRIPYPLSRDYWLYQRRLEETSHPGEIRMIGDSVIWGEYVLPDGTLSHFLTSESGLDRLFINAGVNGLFPLAMEGLVEDYGASLANSRVLLHCNLLWLSSPKADLSIDKEEAFNHSRLVPQFSPRIPCYRADANERLGAIVERHVGFLQWVSHLENAYYGQKSVPRWTLADDGGDPPRYPNARRNPLEQLTFQLPSPFEPDPDRGPASPRHRPWNRSGARPTEFEWVDPERSLQWHAFQRVLGILRARSADVLVLVGPFNEAMLTATNRKAYLTVRNQVRDWLDANQIKHVIPDVLPDDLYADASHPLTAGYQLLAKRMLASPGFQDWIKPVAGGGPPEVLIVPGRRQN